MKLFLVSLLVVAALATSFEYENRFLQFVQKYDKKYSTEETIRRFMIFKENLQEVEQLNAETELAEFEVNEFSDMSKEEFQKQKKGFAYVGKTLLGFKTQQPTVKGPDAIDWTTKGAVTPVKNQGSCGSCWAFSTTGSLEGQWFLSKGKLISLSESNLVDCSKDCWNWPGHGRACNQGCNGGLQPCAFTYIKAHGIDDEKSYPYKAQDGTCKFNASNVAARLSDWAFAPEDEAKIADYLAQYGPLAIAVDASRWSSYKKGIYDVSCKNQLDHAVLLVGYGTDNGVQYWKIKNSWGTSWGEQGYIRLKRGVNECRVKEFVVRPIVS